MKGSAVMLQSVTRPHNLVFDITSSLPGGGRQLVPYSKMHGGLLHEHKYPFEQNPIEQGCRQRIEHARGYDLSVSICKHTAQ